MSYVATKSDHLRHIARGVALLENRAFNRLRVCDALPRGDSWVGT